MTSEVLIPKMKRQKKKFRIPFLFFLLIFSGVLALTFATFLGIELKHYYLPIGVFTGEILNPQDFIREIYYIPQIPVLLLICSALGKKLAVTSVFLYIIAGISGAPFFALGGGIKYFFQYGFGYILAYIPTVAIFGNILDRKYSYKNMILTSILGTLIIHSFGFLYMTVIALIKQEGINFIKGWLVTQSGIKIIYDIVIGFVFIVIGKHINEALKNVLK